jgi:hypothetical protein
MTRIERMGADKMGRRKHRTRMTRIERIDTDKKCGERGGAYKDTAGKRGIQSSSNSEWLLDKGYMNRG